MPKAQRVTGLVDAAVAEFLERGYEGASMERIASRAGVTKGGLYHHFPGKDALLIFATQALAQPVFRILTNAMSQASPVGGLARYIKGSLGFWARRPRQLELFFLTMTKLAESPDARRGYSGSYRETTEAVATLYRRGLEAGELRGLEPRATALALVAALDGALGMILIDPRQTATATAAAIHRALVGAFTVGPQATARRRTP